MTTGAGTVTGTVTAGDVIAAARQVGLHLRVIDADHVGLSTSERTSPSTVSAVLRAFQVYGPGDHPTRLVPVVLAAARTGAPVPLP